MPPKKSFPLRINEETWEAVRRWSDEELRSVNAQVEYVIREALRKAGFNDARFSTPHSQMVDPADRPRYKDLKVDAGVGLRFMAFRGVVRLDWAVGDEGSSVWAMFAQPFSRQGR